jgi:hypothetical protein
LEDGLRSRNININQVFIAACVVIVGVVSYYVIKVVTETMYAYTNTSTWTDLAQQVVPLMGTAFLVFIILRAIMLITGRVKAPKPREDYTDFGLQPPAGFRIRGKVREEENEDF